MSKYIDADDVRRAMLEAYPLLQKGMLNRTIDNMPAANVTEVKHGEWVFKFYCGNMSGYDYGMTCSVCGKPTHRQFAEKMPPYCPNCGAKMDEVSE